MSRDRDFEPADHCPGHRDDIIDYLFDEMGPGAAEAFESHLDSCAGCLAEVRSLEETLARVAGAAERTTASAPPASWEEEWTLLRRRLMSSEAFPPAEAAPPAAARRLRTWLPLAAAVVLTAGIAFTGGYLWRGTGAGIPARGEAGPAPMPIAGASGSYSFDNLDDFSRDTHNFLRRVRMVLMEFTNLGSDSDPTFFRRASTDLLAEATRYGEVAKRMRDRKLGDLLDRIAGVLAAISRIDPENRMQVIHDVRTSLDLTGLIATLELLDAAVERDLKRQSNV